MALSYRYGIIRLLPGYKLVITMVARAVHINMAPRVTTALGPYGRHAVVVRSVIFTLRHSLYHVITNTNFMIILFVTDKARGRDMTGNVKTRSSANDVKAQKLKTDSGGATVVQQLGSKKSKILVYAHTSIGEQE